MATTYILDDKSSFYNGRKVVLVRETSTVGRIVKVVGTNVQIVTDLWHLAAA